MLRNVKIHRMVPFFFFLLPILHSRISHDGKPTNEHVRSAQTHKCITRKKVRVKWWLVHPWLAGWLACWLPRHSSVNFNVLCHDLSRVSARLSPCFGRSSLHPLPLPSSPVVVSLVHSLAHSISRGSHFSFKPHTMRQMNRICETRGSGFGG